MDATNLVLIFATGLFTGGLTCLAVQGGLLTSVLMQKNEDGESGEESVKKSKVMPVLAFLGSKLVVYTLLGLLLGWLGTAFQVSVKAQVAFQLLLVVFMLGTALGMLNVHPLFRYFIVRPPKWLMQRIRASTRGKQVFGPILLGILTILIPCGTTQAMMALAVGSAHPLSGAAIMFAFTLGTSPIFFLLGYCALKFSEAWQGKFLKITAFIIIFLALFNLNAALNLAGSNITVQGAITQLSALTNDDYADQDAVAASTEATISITPEGYSPSRLSMKAGEKVKLTLVNKDAYTCAQAFTLSALNIQEVVPAGTQKTIEFTTPAQNGQLVFSCSMGMYRGVISLK